MGKLDLDKVFTQIDDQFTTKRSSSPEIKYGNAEAPHIPKEIFAKYLHKRAKSNDSLEKQSYKNAYKFYTKNTSVFTRIKTFFRVIVGGEKVITKSLKKEKVLAETYQTIKSNVHNLLMLEVTDLEKTENFEIPDEAIMKFSKSLVKMGITGPDKPIEGSQIKFYNSLRKLVKSIPDKEEPSSYTNYCKKKLLEVLDYRAPQGMPRFNAFSSFSGSTEAKDKIDNAVNLLFNKENSWF